HQTLRQDSRRPCPCLHRPIARRRLQPTSFRVSPERANRTLPSAASKEGNSGGIYGPNRRSSIVRWPRRQRKHSACLARERLVAKAGRGVIVDHARGLHQRVTDGGAEEAEATLLQVLAQGVRFLCARGNFRVGFPFILFRLAV